MKTGNAPARADVTVDWRTRTDDVVDELLPRIREVREHIHAYPEPAGEEFATTEFLQSHLDPMRFSMRPGPEGRGLTVEPHGVGESPGIVLRADIDALRIHEANDVPYRSTRDGLMHACGHDGHAATVLGAVWALNALALEDALPWPVTWRAVFQPAEETARGAMEMIEAGALQGVQAIIGTHMDPTRAVGTIGHRSGAFTADCVEIGISVVGKGGHAARPHESQDPIATAAQLISSIYLFVPRATDSHDPVVVTIGQIHAGDTPNAIPETLHMRGTLRTFSAASRRKTMDHLRKLCRGLAETSDTRIEIEFIEGPPAVINDADLSELMRNEAAGLLGPENVVELERPSMGGEDFANYLPHVRGAMFRLGCGPAEGGAPPLHSASFDLHPESMAIGAKILARSVIEWNCGRRSAAEPAAK